MTSTADALDACGDAGRRLDLQHEVDRAHVDTELEGRGCHEAFDRARLELILDEHALLARDRTVMGAQQLFARELVDARSDALGQTPGVDEDDRRAMLADQLKQPRVDRGPDAVLDLTGFAVFNRHSRHVFDWDLDTNVHGLEPSRVDNGHLALCATKESGDLFERPLGSRKTDPLRLDLGQLSQPLEAQSQVTASLGGGD